LPNDGKKENEIPDKFNKYRPTFRMGKAAKKKEKLAVDDFADIIIREKRKIDAVIG